MNSIVKNITFGKSRFEVYNMTMTKKIRTILLERDMSLKELAEKIETNGNNLSNKLEHDNFSKKELREIAKALDFDYDGIFILRDSGKMV